MRNVKTAVLLGLAAASLIGCSASKPEAENAATADPVAVNNTAMEAPRSASAPGELSDGADMNATSENATDMGVTDHGVTDHGVTDHGVTDH